MNEEKLKILIDKIKQTANKTARCENPEFSAYDFSGGNYDDAYSMGCDDGEILFAQSLLEIVEE